MISTQKPRILLVKLRFHGDMVLTTPLLSALKQNYPDAVVDYLLYKDTLPLLVEHPGINQFYCLTRKPGNLYTKLTEFIQQWIILRRNRYDLVINLADQWPIALLIKLLNCKSMAFSKTSRWASWWKSCFSIVTPEQGEHVVERNLSILQPLKLAYHAPKLSIYYHQTHWLSLQQRHCGPQLNQPYVVVQPTARQRFKFWDDDKFALVIDELKHRGLEVFLTAGASPADLKTAESIYALCKSKPIIALAGRTSLLELSALIDNAVLFVGVDSAPMHIAAAFGTPIVCLFGATNRQRWRPWCEKYRLLWAGDYQMMPERKDLNRQHRYLSCIPVHDVIRAIDSLLPIDTIVNNRGNMQ